MAAGATDMDEVMKTVVDTALPTLSVTLDPLGVADQRRAR
jgi:hypothetical protein